MDRPDELGPWAERGSASRAASRDSRREAELSRYFVAVLTAFLLGVLVASSGFLLGASLG